MSREGICVAFLDVGQGDSTVVTLRDHSSAIVVDCPSKSTTIDYLEQKRITKLSYVCITHTDIDHIGGVADLVANFSRVGEVQIPAYNHDTANVNKGNRRLMLRRLLELHERYGLTIVHPRAGQSWTIEGLHVDILHPAPPNLDHAVLYDRINDASIVLKLSFEQFRVLLPADLQALGWSWVMARGEDLGADILKFPHHGAWYDPGGGQPSLNQVLQRINPSLAVISVGSNNRYDHPDDRTVQLLCSRPGIRFAHTQPTERCYSIVETRRGPFSCSGTVEVLIRKDAMDVVGEDTSNTCT